MNTLYEMRMKMKKEIINLNLIMSYPVKWSEYKIFRDYIQNFYDSVNYKEFKDRFSYDYDKENKTLTLKCSDVSYSYEWLLHIGGSTKTDSEESSAGYFGEGFKVASLCARRDFGMGIKAASKNWTIKVSESDIYIDGNKNSSLAYELETFDDEQPDSILILTNVEEESIEIFESALYTFFYTGNPLIGEEIYSDSECAVYKRSNHKKPEYYPGTFDVHGDGIIFAAYQARGSIKDGLIYCYHDYKSGDRDRDNFPMITNIDIIIQCIYNMTPAAARELLIMHKRYWYSYPKEKFGYRSYYTVIKCLILRICREQEEISSFLKEYPKLLYAVKIPNSNRRALNDRKYCLVWLKNNKDYTLVQDSFRHLNVQSLEDKCREDDLLPRVEEPSDGELKYINLLKDCAKEIFKGFIDIDNLPECRVIRNLKATVSGYASLYKNTDNKHNSYGYLYKYRIENICVKDIHLKPDTFSQGLAVYIHELCHCFGGDKSEVFSYALTDAMEILLENIHIVDKYKELWKEIKQD